MNEYRGAGAHMEAMPKLLTWCDEAAIAHWTQDNPEVPTPAVAFDRMRREAGPQR